MPSAESHMSAAGHGKLSAHSAGRSGQGRPGATPHRNRPRLPTMLFGLFGAAAIWFLQTEFGETVTAQVCYRRDTMPEIPQWLMPAVSAATVCALLIGIAGAGVAWRNWRVARRAHFGTTRSALDTREGREHFLALAGLLLSLLFLIGLVAAGLAVLLVSPCNAWR